MIVAFDIDDTLYKIRRRKVRGGDCVYGCEGTTHCCGNWGFDQVPDYELLTMLHWFYKNGDTIWVWSAGGMDYAQQICAKLGIDDMVKVVPKQLKPWDIHPDICFDDEQVHLARANVRVKREGAVE